MDNGIGVPSENHPFELFTANIGELQLVYKVKGGRYENSQKDFVSTEMDDHVSQWEVCLPVG